MDRRRRRRGTHDAAPPPDRRLILDAIKLLEEQHEEVEALFDEAEEAESGEEREALFARIGDALAVHAAIEEKIFYPAVFGEETHDMLLEAVEEHLAAKRVIADLIELDPEDEHFRAKIMVLKEEILHHVREERKELLPKARKLLDRDQLEALGQQMLALVSDLEAGAEAPRMRVPAETAEAAPLPGIG